jgi:hypothetical protein
MSAKPKHGPARGGSYVERARAAWTPLPDYILALARAADALPSQGAVAQKLGCSAAAVSAMIANSYAGRKDRMKARIEGAFMSAVVDCPALGMSIGRDDCATNQRRKPCFANPQMAKFPRACAGCANAIGGGA